jgi:FMN phosphatase YigB (HAD superfamily)
MGDPAGHLASWNDTQARRAIVDFVERVSERGDADYVAPHERIAVFDNDGTLWPEKPIPIQLDFSLFRMAELAARDTSLASRQPYKAAADRDYHWLDNAMIKHYHGDHGDLQLLMAALESAFESMSIDEYSDEVLQWLRSSSHPTLKRPYLSCGYVPMIELLRYLEANGFTTYIASGGDRDFMRPFAEELYGVPPERVIGSAFGLEYQAAEEDTKLLYKSKIEFFDDGPEKPVRIWSRIGRRPLLACGNSNGDVQMLRFARVDSRPLLRILILHDDAEREFDYTAGAEEAIERAHAKNWTVVSTKNDWNAFFPHEV